MISYGQEMYRKGKAEEFLRQTIPHLTYQTGSGSREFEAGSIDALKKRLNYYVKHGVFPEQGETQ